MGVGACAADQESIAVGRDLLHLLGRKFHRCREHFRQQLVDREAQRREAQSRAHIYRRLLMEIVTLDEKKTHESRWPILVIIFASVMTLAWIVALSLLWWHTFLFIFGSDFNQWLCV